MLINGAVTWREPLLPWTLDWPLYNRPKSTQPPATKPEVVSAWTSRTYIFVRWRCTHSILFSLFRSACTASSSRTLRYWYFLLLRLPLRSADAFLSLFRCTIVDCTIQQRYNTQYPDISSFEANISTISVNCAHSSFFFFFFSGKKKNTPPADSRSEKQPTHNKTDAFWPRQFCLRRF